MSDLLTIAPPEWVQINPNEAWIEAVVPLAFLSSSIASENWADIDNEIRGMPGFEDHSKTIAKARLLFTDTGYQFWVLFN